MKQTLIIKFKITGNLRYLSHRETMAMFQKAVVRAGVDVCYSQGFNPRPALSLPLPRSVSVESDGDILSAVVMVTSDTTEAQLQACLSQQLPVNCRIDSVSLLLGKTFFQPLSAEYVFPIIALDADEKINDAAEHLRSLIAANEPLFVERTNPKKRVTNRKNITPLVASVERRDGAIVVKYNITPTGSVRVDEIMKILKIDSSKLASPIRRTSIEWKRKN